MSKNGRCRSSQPTNIALLTAVSLGIPLKDIRLAIKRYDKRLPKDRLGNLVSITNIIREEGLYT